MGNLDGFDASTVEPQTDFAPIPAGQYAAMITSSEMKATRDGSGSFLHLTLDIVEGHYEGRKVFDRLNLNNRNPQAVDIAQRTLSSICRAVGIMTPRDSSELHDRPMRVKVVIKPAKDGYEAGNEIKGYSSLDESAPSSPAAPSAPAAKPAPAGPGTPPWKRS